MALQMTSVTAERKQKAQESFTLTQSQSPFLDGVTFQITAHDVVDFVGNENATPVLVTSIGNLFPSMITRARVDSKGNILTPDGSFNREFTSLLLNNRDKNNKQVLDLVVTTFSNKTIKVTRKLFAAKRANGTEYPSSLIVLDII